jgi:O-acetylhomoserine/O-acetylserine sulfhydrylase-like pyridoxal-dependent enzyme
VLKVKAHNEAHVCKAIELQTFANIIADGLADFGATLNRVNSDAVAVELKALDLRAGLVITRLVKIGLSVARILDKRKRAAKVGAGKLGKAIGPHVPNYPGRPCWR